MKPLHFTKMHGLGNDFIIVNAMNNSFSIKNFPIQQLADRYRGIGFDQLLLIEPSKKADFACRIYNSDASEAEQCGNGMRCVARFLQEEKLTQQSTIRIETKAGIVQATIQDYEHIQINMGIPVISANRLPLEKKELTLISIGNPHAILTVPSIEQCPVQEWGQKISTHAHFPNGTNVGFMEILNRNHIRLRTYERGAGETHACGSNACAATVAGIQNKVLDSPVTVEVAYGKLKIEWQGPEHPVLMTGPATRVFDGTI